MKKWLAVLLAVLLLIGTTAVGVSAETTKFTETSRIQTDKTVGITYEASEGAVPTKVFIGGVSCPISVEGPGMISVSLETVPTGVYTTITYDTDPPTAGTPIVVEGDPLEVTLELEIDDNGKVTVTATDYNEHPAQEYQLSLNVNGMSYTAKTNANGVHESPYTVDEGNTATVSGVSTVYTYGGYSVTYADAPQVTERRAVATTTTTAGETTTTVSEETTTTVTEETTTTVQKADATTASTASTTMTVKGEGTTALADGMIAMNASTDTALLEAFGLTRQEFAAKARLLLSEEDYEALVGRTNNTLMLNVRTSTTEVTPLMVQSALANLSDFSGYAEDQRQVMTFDLSLLMLSRNGKEVPITALPEGTIYTIQLPVPTSMKSCAAFAITVMDGDALMEPQTLEVKNGMFELKINSLEAYTLIGFGEDSGDEAGGLSWRLIVLLVAGILLIAGAGVLLYLFVFRKPEEQKPADEQKAAPLEENDTDIFSGRTDIENTWEPEDN